MRRLTRSEIRALEAGGSTAEDWARVRVAEGFRPETVERCRFGGEVRIGRLQGAHAVYGAELPSGLRDSRIHDAEIGADALVEGVGLLSRAVVGAGACLWRCECVAGEGRTGYGNGVVLELWNEAGGRAVKMHERWSAPAAFLAAAWRHRPGLVAALDGMAEQVARERSGDRVEIGPGARCLGAGLLRNVRIGAHAVVEGAARLENGSVLGAAAAPARIGRGVQAEDFLVLAGSEVDGGAILSRCFVGEACRIGKGFSAQHSAFFANSEAFHGEALSVLAGPFTVTHHKGSLLIAGCFSFYNAGSASNQSNHLYRLGPVHQGMLERGAKTGSFSYLMWPARVGAFTAVIGKHHAHFDAGDLPFSLILEQGGRSVLRPGAALFACGPWRDAEKWRARDRRPSGAGLDPIRFEAVSPRIAGAMVRAIAALDAAEPDPKDPAGRLVAGLPAKTQDCLESARRYALALDAWLGGLLAERLETGATLGPAGDGAGAGEWVDWLGWLAPRSEAEWVAVELETGRLADAAAFAERLDGLAARYPEHEWNWAREAWRARRSDAGADDEDAPRAGGPRLARCRARPARGAAHRRRA